MPYRQPAEMPEEEVTEMDDKTFQLKIWRTILTAASVAAVCIAGCNVAQTVHNNHTDVLKIQLQSTPEAREATRERYLEAKALSDRAMFEGINKQADKPAK